MYEEEYELWLDKDLFFTDFFDNDYSFIKEYEDE